MAVIDYHGYEIEARPELIEEPRPARWRVWIRMTHRYGRVTRIRYFQTPETFPTEEAAIERCFEHGKRLVDGQVKGVAKVDLP
jgi:hypothetical protein